MKIFDKVCFLLFLNNVESQLKSQHGSCAFNPLCSCSNAGPDLGSVICHNIPFMTIPKHINNSAIYIMSLRNNQLRFVEDSSLNGTGLWKLQINFNLLTNLSPNSLVGLGKTLSILDLSQNHLIRIPKEAIENLEKLSSLNLAGNHITYLYNDDFRSAGRTLKLLDLSHNALMHVQTDTFRNMVALETLNLAFNVILSIDDITFQNGLNNLKHILLMGNQLQQIPINTLAALKSIKIVNLNDNMISAISEGREIRNKIYLEELHLEKNLITELTPQSFRSFHQINRLYLKGNPIEVVNDTFLNTNGTEVYMQQCKISTITPNAFYSVANSLQILDLSFNNLKEHPILPLTKLVRLSLAGNFIDKIEPENVKGYGGTLKYLDIRGPKMGALTQDVMLNLYNLREFYFTKKHSTLKSSYLSSISPSMEKLSFTTSSIKVIENGAFQRLNSLKELDLSYNSINKLGNSSFTGVRHTLKKLILHKSLQMSIFPYKELNTLTKLEYLDLSANSLAYLPYESFIPFQKLKHLNLNNNKIKELKSNFISDINNPEIEKIKIAFNKIVTLNSWTFQNLQNLVYLQINDNLIRHIKKAAFLDLDSLISIQLEGNSIESIDNEAFQNLPNIQFINLAYNNLLNFNLKAFNQVGRLSFLRVDVDHNSIQNLTTDYTVTHTSSNIKSLNFSHNNISVLDGNYFDPIRTSVITIDLSYNNIENLTTASFVKMAHLQILSLSNNVIDDIDEDEFKGTIALQILNLSKNNIKSLPETIFEEQTKLRIFQASRNYMEDLPDGIFSGTILEHLDLSFNNFKTLPKESITQLKNTLQYLDLSGNQINFLNFSDFRQLQYLRHLGLSQNMLSLPSSEEYFSLQKLIYLDLSHNPLQQIPEWMRNDMPKNVEILNLANTSLKQVPVFSTNNILSLNLSSNMIQTLKQESLNQLQQIQTLDISNNLLNSTFSNVWVDLKQLKNLYLQNNPIEELSNTSFMDMVRLEQLSIINLPITSLQKDVFYPLLALRKLEMNTTPLKNAKLSELLSKNYGIKEIHLHVQENMLEEVFDDSLPKSLRKIILEGENLKHIDVSRFSSLQSQELFLGIKNTNISNISHNFFKNMKDVKNFTASFINNKLRTIPRLYTPSERQVSRKYLKQVKLSENQLFCDCDLFWIWEWIREYEFENRCEERACEITYLKDLRSTKCVNIDNKSIIDAFKTDLNCFSDSLANTLFLSNLSVLVCVFMVYNVIKKL